MKKNETGKLSYDELESDEKILLEWYHENPLSVYIEIALIALEELGVITKEEYGKYKMEAVEKADLLKTYWLLRGEELSCTKTI